MTNNEQHATDHQSANGRLWARLFVRRAKDQAALVSRLDALEQRFDALEQILQRIAGQFDQPQIDTGLPMLQETVAALERQINKAGREQFKANTLAETQATQLAAALEALQSANTRRDDELGALREQARDAQVASRLEVVRAILPALDGLDEAIRSGHALLAHLPGPQAAANQPHVASRWLRRWFAATPATKATAPSETRHAGEFYDSVGAWLQGLDFVRGRLLGVLANESVRPIDAEGQPFDPALHIALQALPAGDMLRPGTVAAEIRRGYTVGGRVLRHAEVAVASE